MFCIIVAIGKNNEIGKDNKLLWHIPDDLKKFKEITLNKRVVMGRKTYESIGKPLPNRENIVISKNKNNLNENNLTIYTNIDYFIEKYKNSDEEIFIIGGASIYKLFLEKNLIDKMYISHIEYENNEADSYFPKIDYLKWKILKKENYKDWEFCIYEKIRGDEYAKS